MIAVSHLVARDDGDPGDAAARIGANRPHDEAAGCHTACSCSAEGGVRDCVPHFTVDRNTQRCIVAAVGRPLHVEVTPNSVLRSLCQRRPAAKWVLRAYSVGDNLRHGVRQCASI